MVFPLDRRLGRVVGRRVVGGPAVVGALRVLRVPLQMGRAEQAFHGIPALVLSKQLRLAHAGAAAELVALVLGRRRRVVPVAGHLFRRLLDGVLWALSPVEPRARLPRKSGRRRVRGNVSVIEPAGQPMSVAGEESAWGCLQRLPCSTELFFRDARRKSPR